MIKASELRKKYFGDDNTVTADELKCQKQRIATIIESYAQQNEESVTVIVPYRFKKVIASWLEDNEYTVIGINAKDNALHVFWTKDLVEQMVEKD